MTLLGAYVARLDLGVPHHLGVIKKMTAQRAALQTALGPVDHFAIDGLSVTRGLHGNAYMHLGFILELYHICRIMIIYT